jgi:Uma2 family endonuclease
VSDGAGILAGMIVRIEDSAHVTAHFLEERHKTGADRWDEVWEGVIHLVPSPTPEHQILNGLILAVTIPIATRRGLNAAPELSLFRPGSETDDFRQPDISYFLPLKAGARLERAELVVEIHSPADESYEKIPWYFSKIGVKEILVVHPETRFPKLFLPDGSKQERSVRSNVLGVTFEAVDGPQLRIAWDGGEARV